MKKAITRVRLAVFAVIMGTGVGYAVSGPLGALGNCFDYCKAARDVCVIENLGNCDEYYTRCMGNCRRSGGLST